MTASVRIIPLERHVVSPHFSTVGVRASPQLALDPFLNLDLFTMSQPVFPPHPHAGFSAVTYMLPESIGAFRNRDSLGDSSLIQPGDLHWTQAGAGMLHEEVPVTPGVACSGFQMFVNLAAAHKRLAPAAFHLDAAAVPVVQSDTFSARVLAGSFMDVESPLIRLATKPTIVDVTIHAGARATLTLADDRTWFLFIIAGQCQVAGHEPVIAGNHLVLLPPASGAITLEAPQVALRALLCGGVPLKEPVVWGGPFAMNSRDEIAEVEQRYRQGLMGRLLPSF